MHAASEPVIESSVSPMGIKASRRLLQVASLTKLEKTTENQISPVLCSYCDTSGTIYVLITIYSTNLACTNTTLLDELAFPTEIFIFN